MENNQFVAAIFQVEIFWIVTPCSVVLGHQRFRGPCFITQKTSTWKLLGRLFQK